MEEQIKEEPLDADKKDGFMKEYRELCRKWGCDFAIESPRLVKIDFPPENITPKNDIK